MELDMEKMRHLTPRQVKMVEKIVGFLRYCDEIRPEGDADDLDVFGPPEAYYHPSNNFSKLP
ncbi:MULTISPECIES: hypothetical protein [Rahnella]|uniref:Uncharacterized protein n=1 Tax=Rahnella variigena TaxID=574964 RepID=A0ABX9Q0S5_9GAMM|nr:MULTISPECIES: hypothetical protein [Rahnella]RBQ35928.1 hypothetical protein C2125_00400 [Rahnella aquatilis]RJT54985.1 hypothetical protein D6D38_05670 [Rahnella variigena]RKF70387.1 hypothetical protein CKQ54_19280 [Rahnella variigena]